MSYPKTIVVAAAIIAGAVALSIKAQANPLKEGRYQIVRGYIPAPGADKDIPVIWRLDAETGQVVYCLAPVKVKGSEIEIQRSLWVKCLGSIGHLPLESY